MDSNPLRTRRTSCEQKLTKNDHIEGSTEFSREGCINHITGLQEAATTRTSCSRCFCLFSPTMYKRIPTGESGATRQHDVEPRNVSEKSRVSCQGCVARNMRDRLPTVNTTDGCGDPSVYRGPRHSSPAQGIRWGEGNGGPDKPCTSRGD